MNETDIVDIAAARKARAAAGNVVVDHRGKATVRSFDSLGALLNRP